MSRNYSIVEPHPTVPKSGAYLHVGRGGAGNLKKYTPEELTLGPNASGPASRTSLSKPTPRLARTGRGGAGNYGAPVSSSSSSSSSSASASSEDDIFQFDEDLQFRRGAAARANPAPVYHVGRGGAGNLFWERPAGAGVRKDSSSSSGSGYESERVSAGRRGSAAVAGGVLGIFSRRAA